jgi:hypothetical protein
VTWLAEFIMRGRAQALLVAVVGAASILFSWISAAAVALVTLRKGAGEGAWLLLWALLPALVVAWRVGDVSYLALLAGTAGLALVLRATVSLGTALLASVALGLVTGGLMLAFGGDYLALVNDNIVEPYLALREQALEQAGNAVTLPRPGVGAIAGAAGTGTAVMAVMCLLLARYWQAALYNPGGFGEEFRALRYPLGVSAALALGVLALSSLGLEWSIWAMLGLVPLTFAGIGLVHARARARHWSTAAVALFYLSWLLLPMQLVMVFLAVTDSVVDFRTRWQARDDRGQGPGPQDS